MKNPPRVYFKVEILQEGDFLQYLLEWFQFINLRVFVVL